MSKSLSVLIVVMSAATFFPCFAAGEDLVGPATREAILKHNPDWEATAAAYQPVPEAIARLRSLGREVRIEVYFGSWCSDCAAHIPAFFKILEMVDSPLIKVSYTGLPRDRAKRGPYTGGREIARIPTIIVFIDGRETGRIVETPTATIEEDLARILGL